MRQLTEAALLMIIIVNAMSLPALAWNRPGHMVSATIGYQALEKENPAIISTKPSIPFMKMPNSNI